MCTLALLRVASPEVAFVVAANRDERRDRPSRPPFSWGSFVAPIDEVHGGTWLGLSRAGLFVGVTNRAGTPRDPRKRSRGELVRRLLEAHELAPALELLRGVDADEYSPCHLLFAQGDRTALWWSDGERWHEAPDQGALHVVTEQSFRGEPVPREALVRRAWPEAPSDAALLSLLAIHGETPFTGTCVHFAFDDGERRVEYGTRSSMVLTVRRDLARSTLLWVEGAPCTHPAVDLSSLLGAA